MASPDLTRDRQLAVLLETGLDADDDTLEARLRARCDDPSLIAEAIALLRSESESSATIGPPIRGARKAIEAFAPQASAPPRMIGDYRIVRVIGEGGMGVVYEAEQAEPVERRVAIKLLRSALTLPWERARFEIEQQALARLSHPNVAQMFAAGMTTNGRPYVVMELVSGLPLTSYCDRNHLGIAPRLSLFVAVCRAVEHAHRRQLIHRDLKPSNILVTENEGQPTPKVIDFGIAKLLDADSEQTGTVVGSILGTPSYMSPESQEGSDVDTRTDVYSLGILLYELLCGARPFGDRETSAAEVMRRTREDEPTRPSRRIADARRASAVAAARGTTPRALRTALANDLDWIVFRAMAKDRAERYDSAAALAEDIERYLLQRPVEARPPSLAYRLGKLAKRHRAASVAAALALVAALFAIAFAIRYTVDVKRERRTAEDAREQAEQIVTFLLDDLYAELEPFARRDFLDRVATQVIGYFDSLPEPLRADSAVRHAQALRNLGRVRLQQGDIDGGQVAIEAALALDQRAVDSGAGPDALDGLAYDHRRMADVLERLGERDAALASVERALAIRRDLLAADPDSLHQREEIAWDLSELGWALRDKADLSSSIDAFRRSVSLRRELLTIEPRPDLRKWLGATLKDLGATLSMSGNPLAGEPIAEEAVRMLTELADSDPTRTDYLAEAASAWWGLSTVIEKLGDRPRSIDALRQSIRLFERWTVRDPTVSQAWEFLAAGHLEMASLLTDRSQAEAAAQRALTALQDLVERSDTLPVTVIQLQALLELGRVEEARAPAEQIIAAGWHESRPYLAGLMAEAGLLARTEPPAEADDVP